MPDKRAEDLPRNPGPLLVAVVILLVGTVLVVMGHWRRGPVVMAGALALAALLRLTLSDEKAGLLVIRRRWVDVAVLLTMAFSIAVLALVVPGTGR